MQKRFFGTLALMIMESLQYIGSRLHLALGGFLEEGFRSNYFYTEIFALFNRRILRLKVRKNSAQKNGIHNTPLWWRNWHLVFNLRSFSYTLHAPLVEKHIIKYFSYSNISWKSILEIGNNVDVLLVHLEFQCIKLSDG